MLRYLRLLSAAILFSGIAPATHAQSQNPPSLGDVARQARKDKEDRDKNSSAPKTVISNDDLVSGRAGSALGLGEPASPASGGSSTPPATPAEHLDRMDAVLTKLDSFDRATLVGLALKGVDFDFPNRRAWENHLFAAKQEYVARGRGLGQQMRQMLEAANALDAAGAGPNDPRGQPLLARIKGIVQQAVQLDAAFQAIILEGRDLAKQASKK